MKALSIRQPWAWAIVNGFKDIENRSRRSHHRGEFAIHAGKQFDMEGYKFIRENFPNLPLPDPSDFDMGGIVGKAELAECVSESDSPWFFGPFGYRLDYAEPCELIPMPGQLGLFNVGDPEFNFTEQAARAILL